MLIGVELEDEVAVEEVVVFVDELFERFADSTLLRLYRIVDDVDVELRDSLVIPATDLLLILFIVSLNTSSEGQKIYKNLSGRFIILKDLRYFYLMSDSALSMSNSRR